VEEGEDGNEEEDKEEEGDSADDGDASSSSDGSEDSGFGHASDLINHIVLMKKEDAIKTGRGNVVQDEESRNCEGKLPQ